MILLHLRVYRHSTVCFASPKGQLKKSDQGRILFGTILITACLQLMKRFREADEKEECLDCTNDLHP